MGLLFENIYLFSVSGITYIFFLQNWGDYTDMSQAVAIYFVYASDVLLICWCGSQLTQHVRKYVAVIVTHLVNLLCS